MTSVPKISQTQSTLVLKWEMRCGATLDRLSTDVMGPLPLTPRGNHYILTVSDNFTNRIKIFAIPNQTALTCADKIFNEVICHYGCPVDIRSDQGRNYESQLFAELCKVLEIRKTRSSPRHPEGNGQNERLNRTMLHMLRSYMKVEQDKMGSLLRCHCLCLQVICT